MAKRRKTAYAITPEVREQRRDAALKRWGSTGAKEFATVRIDRRMRAAADAVRDEGESLAAVVTEAVAREVERRGGEAPED